MLLSSKQGFSPDTTAVTGSYVASFNREGTGGLDSVEINSSGNTVYQVGYVQDANGLNQCAVIRQNTSNANIVFQRQLGNVNNGTESLLCSAMDGFNNLYVAGYTDTGNNSGEYSAVLAKYNSNLQLQWQKEYYRDFAPNSINFTASWQGVAADSSGGNIYTCGLVRNYDSGNATTSSYGSLVRYSSNGSATSRYQCPNSYYKLNDVATTGSSYILAGGLVVANITDYYGTIEKFYANGTSQWANTVRVHNSPTQLTAINIDNGANIIAIGFVSGSSNISNNGPVLFQFDSGGNVIWALQANREVGFRGVCTDSSNNIYIAGSTDVGFINNNAPMYCKFDSSGTPKWQNQVLVSPLIDTNTQAYFSGVKHAGSNVHLVGYVQSNTYSALSSKLPDDGSGTGTYGFYTVQATSITFTDVTGNVTTDNSLSVNLSNVANTTLIAGTASESAGNTTMRIQPL